MAQKRLKRVIFDVIMTSSVKMVSFWNVEKCFRCVFGHSSLGIEGEITTKSGIKGVKVAQMLVFGSKMVKMGNF